MANKLSFFVSFLLVFSIITTSCKNQPKETADTKKQLLDIEREAIQREFENDTAFLSSIMDSTFIELSKDSIKNKHEVLKTIYENNLRNAQNKITLDSFTLENPVVHVYGNSAVVTFIMHTYRKKEDSAFERRTRFYDVWVKRGNDWKAVTWQASSIE